MNNIRATSQDVKHEGSQLASSKHSNVNKHNALCLTENKFPNLPQPPTENLNEHLSFRENIRISFTDLSPQEGNKFFKT
jgi:hypothetical protein